MNNPVFKETMSNLKKFEEICNGEGYSDISKDDSEFMKYFEFRLAESLLKELGDTAILVAKHILVN